MTAEPFNTTTSECYEAHETGVRAETRRICQRRERTVRCDSESANSARAILENIEEPAIAGDIQIERLRS